MNEELDTDLKILIRSQWDDTLQVSRIATNVRRYILDLEEAAKIPPCECPAHSKHVT